MTTSRSPSSSLAGFLPLWSKGPVLSTKSVFSARVVTQCAWSLSVMIGLPFSASHTRTVRSLLAVYRTPLGPPDPPHLTILTLAVCPPSAYSSDRVAVFQTRTVPSLEAEARRGEWGLLANNKCDNSEQ